MDFSLWRAQSTTQSKRRGRRVAKCAGLLLMPAALALIVGAGSSRAANEAPLAKAELDAKVRYCEVCHGPAAQGFHGFYPIPRLAGQQPDYIKNQLQAFIERRRTNNIMFNVAHTLSPSMLDGLADYFHDLHSKPLGGTEPKDLVEQGRKIYAEGISSSDVPPCASCHGADGEGQGEFPRLAGQLPDYIFAKLTNWSRERGQNPEKPDTSAIMSPIAHSLSQQQIKAVAAYVSELP
jgi:cytochrome c553